LLLRAGETARVEAIPPEPLTDVSLRLRLIGEQDLDPRLRQAEGGFTKCYRLIDDALDQRTTHHKTYSLSLKSQGEAFPRRAYWRVPWSAQAPARDYILTIWAKNNRSNFFLKAGSASWWTWSSANSNNSADWAAFIKRTISTQ
jgi:hypothetical protein